MSIAVQVVALFILLAVLYTVIVTLLFAHRRERSREAIYQEFQGYLAARIKQELENQDMEKSRDQHTWRGYRKLEVRRKVLLGESGICEFELAPRDGGPLPRYAPGQYLTFKVLIGREKQSAVRCYSLSDRYRERDKCYRVAIKQVLRPRDKPDVPDGLVSSYFHDTVQEGEILDVRAPAGKFVLDSSQGSPVVLIAGGIGITPLWSMLNEIVEAQPGREAWFFYGVRHSGEHLYRETMERMKSDCDNVRFRICYSSSGEGDTKGEDYDHQGRITIDYLKQELPSNKFVFFICGPRHMMDDLTAGLARWGVPDSAINTEAFGAPGPPSAKLASAEDLEVTFAKSERTIPWDSKTNNILEFAEQNEISMDFGCRAGSCGECQVAVRKGEIDYLTKPRFNCEENCCLTCIAIPKSSVVLEA